MSGRSARPSSLLEERSGYTGATHGRPRQQVRRRDAQETHQEVAAVGAVEKKVGWGQPAAAVSFNSQPMLGHKRSFDDESDDLWSGDRRHREERLYSEIHHRLPPRATAAEQLGARCSLVATHV